MGGVTEQVMKIQGCWEWEGVRKIAAKVRSVVEIDG